MPEHATFDSEIRALSAYLKRERKRGFFRPSFIDTQRKNIQLYADGKAHIGHATVALLCLSSFRAAEGCEAVLRKDARGLDDIDAACVYRSSIVRLLVNAYDHDANPERQPRVHSWDLACAWLHADALGLDAISGTLAPLFGRCTNGDGIGGREASRLATLAAHWATDTDVAQLERDGWKPLGRWGVLVRKPDANDLAALADEHLRQLKDTGDDVLAHYPYRLVPFELLAAARRHGLDPNAVKHPLLQSPMAQRRTRSQPPGSDDVRVVSRRAASELGLPDDA